MISERPVGHLFGQIRCLQEDAEIVGWCMELLARERGGCAILALGFAIPRFW